MSNYRQLSEAELRNYVKTHPDDEDAFQHYCKNSAPRSQESEFIRNLE